MTMTKTATCLNCKVPERCFNAFRKLKSSISFQIRQSPTHVHGRKTGTTPYCSELINSFLRGQQAFFVIFRSRVKLVQLLNEKQGASNNCYFIKVFVEIQHFSQSIQQQNKSSLLVEKMNTRCYQFFNKERSFQ